MKNFYKLLFFAMLLFPVVDAVGARLGNYNATFFTPPVINGPNSVCSGQTAQLSVTYTGTGTIKWYSTIGGPVLHTGTTYTTPTLTAAATYYAELTEGANAPEMSLPKTVGVINYPATPIVTAGGPTTFCHGNSVTLSTPVLPNHTYQWKRNTSDISSADSPTYTVTQQGDYTVTITNSNGCSTTSTIQQVNVHLLTPALSPGNTNTLATTFDGSEFFTRCTTTFPSTINVQNTTTGNIVSYSLDWGDSSAIVTGSGNPSTSFTHSYQAGFYTLTYSVLSNQGCTSTKTYGIFVGNNPSGSMGIPINLSGCGPRTITFPITAPASNIPGTQYIINFGDGHTETYIHPAVPSSVTHTYDTSSCGNNPQNSIPNSYVASMTITNPCYPPALTTVGPIVISTKPKPDFTFNPDPACTNSALIITNTSTNGIFVGQSGCTPGLEKYWTISPATGWTTSSNLGSNGGSPTDSGEWNNGANSLSVNFTTPGNYTVTLFVGNGCGVDQKQKTICVKTPLSKPTIAVTNILDCSPLTANASVTSPLGTNNCNSPITYLWNVRYVSPTSSCGAITPQWSYTGTTNQNSISPSFSFVTAGEYYIKVTINNGCGSISSDEQKVVVKQKPLATINTIPSVCGSSTTSITPTVNFTNCGTVAPVYAWSSTGAATISDPAAASPTISYTSPGNYTVSVTITNECGAVTDSKTFTISPPLTVDAGGDKTICAGGTGAMLNGSGGGGTGALTYLWSPASGLSATNILNPVANPSVTTIYTLKVINGSCNVQDQVSVTVNQVPLLSAIANNTLCNGATQSAINFASSITGTAFTWTNSQPSIGLAASGIGTIPSFTATNTGTAPIVATITVTPEINGCAGTARTFTITVNPTPASLTLSPVNLCHNMPSGTISFGSTAGTTYAWTNSDPSIGLGAGGSGSSISFTALNATSTPKVATITVTPTTNGCVGASQTFTITVNPSAAVTFSQPAQTICSGSSTTAVNLTSTTSGAVFAWTAVVPAGVNGADTSGTDTIPVQTLENTTNAPLTVSYKATASLNGGVTCAGAEYVHTVTVNPKPKVNAQLTAETCSEVAFTVTPANGSGNIIPANTTYTWAAPVINPSGAITGGSAENTPKANISQLLSNTSAAVATATYTVTPMSGNCAGQPFNVVVTVKPKPVANQVTVPAVCAGDNVTVPAFTGNISGITYNWTNSNIAIGLAASGSSDIPSFMAQNNTSSPITATVSVTPSINGCTGAVMTFTITVNPAPAVQFSQGGQTICSGGTTGAVTLTSTTPGASFNWVASVPPGILGATDVTGTATIPAQTLINTTNGPLTITYTATAQTSGTVCPGPPSPYTITVNPDPTISTQPQAQQEICVGGTMTPLTVAYANGVGTPSYQWYSNTSASNSGGTTISGATSSTFTPTTNTTPGMYYFYAVVTLSGNGCGSVASDVAAIKVVADPVITSPVFTMQTLCEGATVQTLTVTPSGGSGSTYNYQWFINGANSNVGGTVITGQTNSTYTPPSTPTGTKYYYCEVSNPVSGCLVKSSVAEVVIMPAPAFTAQPQSGTVCQSQTPAALTVAYNNGTGTASYQWFSNTVNNNASGTAITGANSATYQPSGAAVGTTYYYAQITFSSGGCQVITSTVAAVTIDPLPAVTTPQAETICSGSAFNITPIDGGGNYTPTGTTYTWSAPTGSGFTGGSGQAIPQSSISQTLINITTAPVIATYTVTPRFNSCVGNTFTVTITVNPTAVIADVARTICSDGTFTVDPSTIPSASIPAGTTYSWSAPVVTGGVTGGTAGTGQTIITGSLSNSTTATQTATYTVTPTSPTGNCAGDSFDIVVTVRPQLQVTQILSNYSGFEVSTAGGNDGSIDLTPTGGSGTYSYSWSGPNGFTSALQDVMALTAGTYTVTISDGLCNPVVLTILIREPLPLVIQEVLASHVNVNCFGQNTGVVEVQITQASIAPFDYIISLQGGAAVETVMNLNALNYVFDNLPAGTYDIKVVDANGTAKTTPGIVVTQPASGLAISNAAVSSYNRFNITCNGANNGSIDLSVTGGYPAYTYSWTGPNGFTESTQDIANLLPGSYTVVIGDTTGVCTITQTYIINEPLPLTHTSVPSNYNGFGISCSGGSDGTITITPAGGTGIYTYQWTGPNGFTATTQNLTGLFAGAYTLTVTDSNGCMNSTGNYTLTEPASMAVTETHTNLLCFGASTGSITTTVSGGVPGTSGYIYSWSGPNGFTATTQNLNNVAAGAYTLVVTDSSGCTKSITVTLTQPTEIFITATTTPISCYGANDATITLAISGGVGPYQAAWDNFASGTFQQNLAAGTYGITVTDSNNCTKVISVIIPEAPIFTINPVHRNISCHGANDGSIVLNFVGGQAPITLVWSDGSTSGTSRHNLPPGVYSVTITDSKPCVITRTFVITEPQPLVLSGTVTHANDCNNAMSGAVNLIVSGGMPPFMYAWSNGANTEDLTGITSGNYSVTVTDANGCTNFRQFTVTRPQPLEVSVTNDISFDCATDFVRQVNTATASGGILPYHYAWSAGTVSGANGQTMTTNNNGMVTITVTDGMGCTAAHTFEIDTQQLGDAHFGVASYAFDTYGLYSIVDPIQFTNTSTGDYISVAWDFGDGAVSTENNPVHSYQREGQYMVTQTVTYPYGCVERNTFIMVIEKGYDVMIPTGFTPNGDGVNDQFIALHRGLKSIEIKVYDTWGSMIYYEKGETLHGWDGKVNGVESENGNYYYNIAAETFYGHTVKFEGPCTLIK